MEADVNISWHTGAKVRLVGEKQVLRDLQACFSFYVPGYQFMPKFKARIWDGKIRLLDVNEGTFPTGLLRELICEIEKMGYTYSVDDYLIKALTSRDKEEDLLAFVDTLGIIESRTPRDYQLKAFVNSIRRRRHIVLSATGSGKSLIIMLVIRFLVDVKKLRVVLTVPTVNLVNQMVDDWKTYCPDYDWDKLVHKIYSGQDKNITKPVVVSTWQSLSSMIKAGKHANFFKMTNAVIYDEVHQAKAVESTKIMESFLHAKVRVGFTGTLDDTLTHEMCLRGLFGTPERYSSNRELIQEGKSANITIQPIFLEYSDDERREATNYGYQSEVEFIIAHGGRNRFLTKLATVSAEDRGNVLMLFNRVEQHALVVLEMIKAAAGDGIAVHNMTGENDSVSRELSRKAIDADRSVKHIAVGSTKAVATGTNIVRLNVGIFAHPQKAKITNLQAIGRLLRKGEGKDSAILYDIVDDLSWKSNQNFALKHFEIRLEQYLAEGFDVKKIQKVRV